MKRFLIFNLFLMIICGIVEIALMVNKSQFAVAIPVLIMMIIWGNSRFALDLYDIKKEEQK